MPPEIQDLEWQWEILKMLFGLLEDGSTNHLLLKNLSLLVRLDQQDYITVLLGVKIN